MFVVDGLIVAVLLGVIPVLLFVTVGVTLLLFVGVTVELRLVDGVILLVTVVLGVSVDVLV